ncbi:tetratricopeptide repeat protein 28-like [Orbicella faveolata]|uniref:tetratricopeptide repeat protein 28-like n=1 Tax=Orbicella faveolata TaxID=48498 RepID=UPI0009E6170B|nr:tetratricopeptide repeat protein 28-like [Orbicella faveolata]
MLPDKVLYTAWNVADFLHNTHLYAKAIDFYKECFVLLRLIVANHLEDIMPNEPRDIERQLYSALADAYSDSGNIEKGIEMCKECLKINKEGGNERRESECYEHIGIMYFNLGQCAKSVSYHGKALAMRKGKVSEAQSCNHLCLVYIHLNQYEKAFSYAEKALEVGELFGNRKAQGMSSNNLSTISMHLGRYKKAIEYQEKDLEISKESGDREGEGTCYNNLGGIYFQLGQFHESLEYYEKALKIVQEIGFRKGEGRSYLNLSNAYVQLGEYAKSLAYNEKALAAIRSLGHRHDEGAACLNQASLYSTLGEYEKSFEYCMKALAIKTAIGDKKGQAECYAILGAGYRAHGEDEISIKYVEQSLKISTEIGDLTGQGVSFNNLANTYFSQGHYGKAVEYFEKDLRICKVVGDRNGKGVSCCNIGCAYFALGQLEKSLDSATGVPLKDDVVLTVKEIAEVGIRAKLVVLSCCHSARGKILKAEGVVGIARAFLGSGARSVLMSLWAVDDEATKAFMNIFYKCLIHGKMSASEALHHAIKKTRESSEYKDFKHKHKTSVKCLELGPCANKLQWSTAFVKRCAVQRIHAGTGNVERLSYNNELRSKKIFNGPFFDCFQ